ncbi:regulator of G-protein signaling 6 isoform 2-T2 [Ara ararauna]
MGNTSTSWRRWDVPARALPRPGADIVQWLMKNLSIEDPGEAIHLGSLIAAQGYVFPISDHVLTLKDDGTFYRFQAPYFWPSNCWEPENTDYAIYLCKRTMQNKARLELADYEAENLARLQRAFARKWEFIFMQAEAQVKIDRKKDKTERKILDSQERAFWDVHRPVPGCVNTTEMDIRKCRRMKNPQKVKKSVYGVTEESQPQSPVHVPSQPVRKTTKEDFRKQITFLNMQIERHCLKMSKVAESLIAYTEQYVEYDPFITPAEPSNPWISDDSALWDIEMSKEPSQQRVKRWGFSMDEVLKDPVGRDQFLRFLESEFSSENLRFWLAVQDLKKQPLQDVTTRVEEIWQEFLAPGAQSAINLDSHSYEKTSQNVKDPGRYTYEDAQEHIYKLMKSDSYARFLRSNAYQDLLLAKKKPENEQGRRTSLEKFTRSVCPTSRQSFQVEEAGPAGKGCSRTGQHWASARAASLQPPKQNPRAWAIPTCPACFQESAHAADFPEKGKSRLGAAPETDAARGGGARILDSTGWDRRCAWDSTEQSQVWS